VWRDTSRRMDAARDILDEPDTDTTTATATATEGSPS